MHGFFFSIPALGIKGQEIKVPALSLHRTQRQGRGNREYDDSEAGPAPHRSLTNEPHGLLLPQYVQRPIRRDLVFVVMAMA
jgi:hypothetical protein